MKTPAKVTLLVLTTLAVVATCTARRVSPDHGSIHRDFEKVNAVLAEVVRAGVTTLVAGSSVYSAPDPAGAILALRRAAEGGAA